MLVKIKIRPGVVPRRSRTVAGRLARVRVYARVSERASERGRPGGREEIERSDGADTHSRGLARNRAKARE